MDTFGDRLRSLRLQQNLRQQDLAKHLRISKSTVGMYERGEREPSLSTLHQIAGFFHVSTDYLLARKDSDSSNASATDHEGKDAACAKKSCNLKEILEKDDLYWGKVPFTNKERSAVRELMQTMVSERSSKYAGRSEDE
ncbi:helix-turn-helix domain-containing protein [Paludifilum halophilum]|nr:helix-turn-helix transcriptional regulator [Paludifilum halophilum]